MNILKYLHDYASTGHAVTLTSVELEAINEGISALKTLLDMKEYSASVYGKIVSRETSNKKENNK